MRTFIAVSAALCLVTAAGNAQAKGAQEAEKKTTPVTDQKVDAADVALTPLSDLNIKKTGIPALLISAQERPYSIDGLKTCAALNAAVADLNRLLGDDIDVPDTDSSKPNVGRMAQSMVGSIIPFRGLLRELSGANDQERRLQSAIIAGTARRGFLKGLAQQRGCKGIARPATNGLVAPVDSSDKRTADGKTIVAKPVVQPTP